jgi:putative transposase
MRQRQLSKKKKGSKNYVKARKKVSKLHYHISNIRKDCLHKATSKIINENQVIVLENLKVKNMMKNHSLAQAIGDVGMFEFRRQITYKAKWKNRIVVMANTFYPSSKLCSNCCHKNVEMKLSHTIFKCNKCGLELDRDLNASLNLERYHREGPSRINASGDGSSLLMQLKALSVSPSMNEEFNK